MSMKLVMPVVLGLAVILAVVALTARATYSTGSLDSYFCLTLAHHAVCWSS